MSDISFLQGSGCFGAQNRSGLTVRRETITACSIEIQLDLLDAMPLQSAFIQRWTGDLDV
jgi:hypothetical protein